MSIEAMAIVLNHSRASGTAKLVLLGIANHDGDGGAWPTIDRLATYANVTRSRVHAAIKTLEQLGEVRRIVQQGGDHSVADHKRPNLYHVTVRCPETCDRTKNHRNKSRSIELIPDRVSFPIPGIVSDTGRVSETIPKPSLNQTTKTQRTNSSYRAREETTCINGHHIIATSGGGVPICELGCLPVEVSA